MTPELAQAMPNELRRLGDGLPDVLLGYQGKLLAATAINQVVLCEKSRRIGVTWGIAADAVLTAASARPAGGMDVIYIGYNLDMAREFIDTAAMWAKAFMPAATEVEEFLFKDGRDENGADRHIQAFRITFASGYDIVALTSKPRSLRGRQGYLIFDEAAFHDDLPGMMKAAMAFLIWGGKVLVISTHDGEDNPFNELIKEARAGRTPYEVVRITFRDAIADGLYDRVALMMKARGLPIKPKGQWLDDIYATYGAAADEELDVIPAQGSGVVLAAGLIRNRMDNAVAVLRWEANGDFAMKPQIERETAALAWCEANLQPRLDALDPSLMSVFGEDFARYHDLTVIWPAQIHQDLTLKPPFVVELVNIPFEQQRQVLFYIADRLPRFMAGALDAGGNGSYLAEVTAQRYGGDRIAQVMLSETWYRENMPKLIDAIEDASTVMPKDADILNDHRRLRRIKGVIRVPDLRQADLKNKNIKRHGDSAIAHALCLFAAEMDVAPIEFMSTGQGHAMAGAYADPGVHRGDPVTDTGFGAIAGDLDWRGYDG